MGDSRNFGLCLCPCQSRKHHPRTPVVQRASFESQAGSLDDCAEFQSHVQSGVCRHRMNNEAKRFLAVLQGVEAPTLTTLCQRTLDLLPVDGVSIALMTGSDHQGLAGSSGSLASARQDLEFTLGQGPGVDAYEEGASVVVEDLRLTDGRWPLFSPAALELGVRSVSALPMKIGGIRLGVLYLYGDEPGSIGAEHLESARTVTELITQIVIGLQSQVSSEEIAFNLVESDYRAVVHQATGMISVQLGCSVEEALVRLRGHAFVADRPIDEIAELVVDGSVRFHE